MISVVTNDRELNGGPVPSLHPMASSKRTKLKAVILIILQVLGPALIV